VLECSIRTAQEEVKVFVHSTIGFVPDVIERAIVVRRCSAVYIIYKTLIIDYHDPLMNRPFEDKLPSAAALFPCTSELGELVSGINTSQIPISSKWPFNSSERSE